MSIVSLYPKIDVVEGGEIIQIADIMETQRTDHWRPKIDHLRVRVQEGASKEEIEKLKSKLPYFTASGTFKKRNEAGLIQHSGKLAIDFDKIDTYTTIAEAREKLINDKYSEYVFLSCSGTGICVIVNINPEKHLDSFLYLEKYYLECHGLKIDKGCKDVSRPRYISYDTNLFHNPDCERVSIALPSINVESDEEKFEWVKRVIEKKKQFSEGGRHAFMVDLSFFLNKCGVDKDYTLSRLLNDYLGDGKDEKEIQRIVRDTYKNEMDHGTFAITKQAKDLPPEFTKATKEIYAFAHSQNKAGVQYNDNDIHSLCSRLNISLDIARGIFKNVFEKNKDEFGLDDKPEIYKVELFIKKKYEIVKNEVSQRYEYRPTNSTVPMERLSEDTIYRDLQHAHYKFSLDKLKSLLKSDYIPRYNPFKTYFNSLHTWTTEEADYIDDLANFVRTDNQNFWRVQFKKALVRSIACAVDHKENRIVMTLVEMDQNTGKTNFIRFLCPPFLKEYYTETSMDGSKDSDMQLSENFMWNLEELSALNNIEVNKLKAIISKSTVKQRRAYAAYHDTNPRRANFWASTNKSEFLTDDQNTRWLCFNVMHINHDYGNWKTGVNKIDINNVWAQAWALYNSGYDYHLTAEEAAARDTINKGYEVSSVEKELIMEYYKPCAAHNGTMMTCTNILLKLQEHTDNKIKLNKYAVGNAMKQLNFIPGFKKLDGKNARGYWIADVDSIFGIQSTTNPDQDKKSEVDEILITGAKPQKKKMF